MNYWPRTSEERAEAWALLADLRLDVSLVQEAVPPPDVHAIYRPGGIGKRRWGSAVVSYTGELSELERVNSPYGHKKEVELNQTFPGSVVLAQLTEGQPTVFVSAYGVMEGGYAVTTMHRVLSDLTPLLDTRLGKHLIIGGDFNCSTQLPGRDRERHRNLFERFTTLGLVDLLALTADTRPTLDDCPCSDEPCRHVQTLRHGNSSVPWHNDYLFATTSVAKRLSDCQPVVEPAFLAVSDHCPIVAEFA
jgi:hypothetical protein